jgi:hypothetical protein
VRETTNRDGPFAVRSEYERRAAPASKQKRSRGRMPKYARRRRNAAIALVAGVLLVMLFVNRKLLAARRRKVRPARSIDGRWELWTPRSCSVLPQNHFCSKDQKRCE